MITMATARSVKASVTKSPMVNSVFVGYVLFAECPVDLENEGLRGCFIQIKERQRHANHPREGKKERVCKWQSKVENKTSK